ncbi:MAG: class I SAM-dependent methyltransferase [Myxococcota bacterium]
MAPIYDWTFGRATQRGRRMVARAVNRGSGRVLEVGVGTGLSLSLYQRHLQVEGIDLSKEMLHRARRRVAREALEHVVGLYEMDAQALSFDDETFETVVAMFTITVVPDADQAMREMTRVLRPGGRLFLVNHFSQRDGPLARLERFVDRFSGWVGFHSLFETQRVLGQPELELVGTHPLGPFGSFLVVELRKDLAESATRV